MFEKQSMINRLSNPINRNRSAAKISKVMSSSIYHTLHVPKASRHLQHKHQERTLDIFMTD